MIIRKGHTFEHNLEKKSSAASNIIYFFLTQKGLFVRMTVSQWVLTIYTNHSGGNIGHKHKTIKLEQLKEVRLTLQSGVYTYIFPVTNISGLGVAFLLQGLIRSGARSMYAIRTYLLSKDDVFEKRVGKGSGFQLDFR